MPGLTNRIVLTLGAVIGTGNLYALWWALRRYVNGSEGSVWVFSGAWQPPFGAGVLLAGMAAFATLVLVALASSPREPRPAAASSHSGDTKPAATAATTAAGTT